MCPGLQTNVMALCASEELPPLRFAVMATPYVRYPHMAKAELPNRNADDLRRSVQMAAAQAGDRAAYEGLLHDCVPLIRAFARRQGVPADYIDDVVQDALLTLHRARHTYDPARSFTAWLRTIAERRAIDKMRRIGRQRAREIYAPVAFASYADDTAEVRHSGDAAGARVKQALADLPQRQREAVHALVLEEKSLAEAAMVMGRSKGALKVNLHRALKALRARFEGTR